MTLGTVKKPLTGPWLGIAKRVLAGNDNLEKLSLCAASAVERSKVRGNVNAMVDLGFLAWLDGGRICLTPLGKALTSVEQIDNGRIHWGAGLTGSLCGVYDKNRQEECQNRVKVTCPNCLRILKSRP
jgi:hypothetical protein